MSTRITINSTVSSSESKTHALISYILIAIGLFTAIPIIFGAVWAMIKKNGAAGTIYRSHLVNATRVFWWSLFWTIIGSLFLVVFIGYAIWVALWLWVLYRVVDGFVKILSDEPYPI
jgi:uncharacterized membrane protein